MSVVQHLRFVIPKYLLCFLFCFLFPLVLAVRSGLGLDGDRVLL